MTDIDSGTKAPNSKAKDILREVKEQATDLTGSATRLAKENMSQLSDAASELASQVKDRAETEVTHRKSLGADYIQSLAQATDRAANEFDNELPQAAYYIREASAQVQTIADKVRDRDLREIVNDVQEFAKNQPTIFFGGAVILGFAATRFLKSTAPKTPSASPGSRNPESF